MLNLDTNILIEGLSGGLTKREFALLENEDIAISNIVLWEIAKLIQLKRIVLDIESSAFRRLLTQLTVYPITLEPAKH